MYIPLKWFKNEYIKLGKERAGRTGKLKVGGGGGANQNMSCRKYSDSSLKKDWVLVAHFLNPSTQEAEIGRQISEFEASLVYRDSSRMARATQWNSVLGGKTKITKPDSAEE